MMPWVVELLLKVYGWLFAVVVVMLVFGLTVFAMLYSVIFVTQPIKSMAPIDQAYTKMLNDIVLLIVGGIGGVMSRKGVQTVSEKLSSTASPPPPPSTPTPPPTPASTSTWTSPSGALPAWVNM